MPRAWWISGPLPGAAGPAAPAASGGAAEAGPPRRQAGGSAPPAPAAPVAAAGRPPAATAGPLLLLRRRPAESRGMRAPAAASRRATKRRKAVRRTRRRKTTTTAASSTRAAPIRCGGAACPYPVAILSLLYCPEERAGMGAPRPACLSSSVTMQVRYDSLHGLLARIDALDAVEEEDDGEADYSTYEVSVGGLSAAWSSRACCHVWGARPAPASHPPGPRALVRPLLLSSSAGRRRQDAGRAVLGHHREAQADHRRGGALLSRGMWSRTSLTRCPVAESPLDAAVRNLTAPRVLCFVPRRAADRAQGGRAQRAHRHRRQGQPRRGGRPRGAHRLQHGQERAGGTEAQAGHHGRLPPSRPLCVASLSLPPCSRVDSRRRARSLLARCHARECSPHRRLLDPTLLPVAFVCAVGQAQGGGTGESSAASHGGASDAAVLSCLKEAMDNGATPGDLKLLL